MVILCNTLVSRKERLAFRLSMQKNRALKKRLCLQSEPITGSVYSRFKFFLSILLDIKNAAAPIIKNNAMITTRYICDVV